MPQQPLDGACAKMTFRPPRQALSKVGRDFLLRRRETKQTLENVCYVVQRVMPDLMGLKSILMVNDEAHHLYRRKVGAGSAEGLKGKQKKEAENNKKVAPLY